MKTFISLINYWILIVVFLFSSCQQDPPLFEINNLNDNEISVFGHGGMGKHYIYPRNSYESFKQVLRIGAEGTEMDVQLTKDSVLVLYHEEDLQPKTNCNGIIHDKLWSEIENCKYNNLPYNPPIYLITVDDLFSRINNLNDYIFIFDCKFYKISSDITSFYNQFANAIIHILDKYDMEDNMFIESSNRKFLKTLIKKGVKAKLFISGMTTFKDLMKTAEDMDLYGISIYRNITKEEIAFAHSKNIRVAIWGVYNQNDNLEAVTKSPDFIQSDKPIYLLKMFDKYKK